MLVVCSRSVARPVRSVWASMPSGRARPPEDMVGHVWLGGENVFIKTFHPFDH